jgi:hypothetical protein
VRRKGRGGGQGERREGERERVMLQQLEQGVEADAAEEVDAVGTQERGV